MKNYYYFVTGLKELPIIDENLSYESSIQEFINDIHDEIPVKHRKPIDDYLLRFDNENLCNILEDKDKGFNKVGIFSSDELLEIVTLYREQSEYAINFSIPKYWNNFILSYVEGNRKYKELMLIDELNVSYYHYLKNSSSNFLRTYTDYDFNLKNLATAINAKKFELDKSSIVLPVNDFSIRIVKDTNFENITKEEFNILSEELLMMEKLNVLDLELKLDYKRIEYIDELLLYEYFSIDKILGYLIKLGIALRWSKIDKVKGSEIFDSISSSIKDDLDKESEDN